MGASQGQFYRRFLKPIKLNEVDIDWMQQDLTYLDPVVYDRNLNATLASARCAGIGLRACTQYSDAQGLTCGMWCPSLDAGNALGRLVVLH